MGEMEIEEIEAVLEKIWDLHDKLSDEIHLISRSHFLKSVKPSNRPEKRKNPNGNSGEDKRPGYVFIKGFAVDDNDSTIQEAKSLNAIRTALENLEDQLEFFHIVNQREAASSNIFKHKEFNLESLGIGGRGAEFADIFRRAFASRVFPLHVTSRLGIKHVKGMLLFGPPGTGKTLMAWQIGKSRLLFTPSVKEKAKDIAETWKKSLEERGRT